MSVISFKISVGIVLLKINACRMRVSGTSSFVMSQNFCQHKFRKHSEVSGVPKYSLITKSMNNSKSLESNLFSNRSLPFCYIL